MKGDLGKNGEYAKFSTLEAGWATLTKMVKGWQTEGGSKVYKPYFSLFEMAQRYEQKTP